MEQTSLLPQLMPIILIFVVFYFLLIRPQQKKMRAHREMLAAVRRGDEVVTGGGIVGKVVKVGEDEKLTVEIADEVRVKVMRSTISTVLAKTQPAGTEAPAAAGPGTADRGGLLGKLFPRK